MKLPQNIVKRNMIPLVIALFTFLYVISSSAALDYAEFSDLTRHAVRECLLGKCDDGSYEPTEVKELYDYFTEQPEDAVAITLTAELEETVSEVILDVVEEQKNAGVQPSNISHMRHCEMDEAVCISGYHQVTLDTSCNEITDPVFCEFGCRDGLCNAPPAYIDCEELYGENFYCGSTSESKEYCPHGAVVNERKPGCYTGTSDFGVCYQCKANDGENSILPVIDEPSEDNSNADSNENAQVPGEAPQKTCAEEYGTGYSCGDEIDFYNACRGQYVYEKNGITCTNAGERGSCGACTFALDDPTDSTNDTNTILPVDDSNSVNDTNTILPVEDEIYFDCAEEYGTNFSCDVEDGFDGQCAGDYLFLNVADPCEKKAGVLSYCGRCN